MSEPAVSFEFRAVSKSYGAENILRNLSLVLRETEHTAFLGSSGCGKSTVLRLLAGLETPTAGEVFVGGARASSPGRVLIAPHERGVAMVFQDLGLWPSQSVFENVLLGLDGCGLVLSERRTRAGAALDLCRIGQLAARRPGSLSGGEQQRVALARALAPDPRFLFFDEPFAGLDLGTKRDLLQHIQEVAADRHTTIVLVTHDPTEALSLCTQGVLLEGGGVAASGPWHELLSDPRSDLLRAFRECAPADLLAAAGVVGEADF